MPAKKNSITTPLHLLQQLSHSLVAHLQKACNEAQRDAEVLLAKLEKQRGKTQEKVIKARAKLDEAGDAGKSKAQSKARARLAELDDMLAVLQARQSETLGYLSELKRDAEQSLKLARGITDVEKAAAQALATRQKPAAATRSKAPTKATKPAAAEAAPAKPAAGKAVSGTVSPRSAASRSKPAVKTGSTTAKPAEAKAPATKAADAKATSAPRRPASKPASTAKPASAASRPAAAKKPARKPAAKRETSTQSPPVAS
ncbi:transcriptional regulator [Pseudomonas sp. MTM4]|uniref:AlgP family protein n=1 Tax=unclassified Pseudomonas TaxID=196821 RepID=UPI0018D23E44|nr:MULTISPECIES: AlgP family protein [unclassified Pseudomonas]MBC8649772.1 transcriptional regulator [Pseudomonas sp. MT4]QXY92120.1 transcriptional regulator [Pseudomonas sp. MTM4]